MPNTAKTEEPEIISRGYEVLSITAGCIMMLAENYKNFPKCKDPAHDNWLCPLCEYNHCPNCRHDYDCECLVTGCSTWERCGLNEACLFLMDSLPGLTAEQAKGLMTGEYVLEGQSASTARPDDTIYVYKKPDLSFADQAMVRLGSCGDASSSSREKDKHDH